MVPSAGNVAVPMTGHEEPETTGGNVCGTVSGAFWGAVCGGCSGTVAAVGGVLPEDGKVSGGNVPTVPVAAGVVAWLRVRTVDCVLPCACAANAANAPTSATEAAANARVADEMRRRPASRCR